MNNKITKEEEIEIVKLYTIEKLSMKKVGEKVGYSEGGIKKVLDRNKINRRSKSIACKKYSLNINYFEKIDSHEKAQILGFWAADGCLLNTKYSGSIGWRMSIFLSIIDINYLEYIKSKIEFTGPISFYTNKKGLKYAGLVFNDYKMFHDMKDKGLNERKSLTLEFPSFEKVPKEFISSYLLGYWEGDGHSTNTKVGKFLKGCIGFCVSKPFGEKLKEFLWSELSISCYLKVKHKTHPNGIWSLRVGGNKQVIKLFNWLYSNAPYKMQRKYDKYIALIKDIEYKQSIQHLLDNERNEKIRNNNIGRSMSLESRQKMSQSHQIAQTKNQKTIWLKNKDEIVYKIFGISRFCREHKVDRSNILRLLNKQYQSCNGWRIYDINSLGIPEDFIELNY